MKRFLLLAAALLLTGATPRPWSAVATLSPSGSYVIGNPKARVKLIEYVSYTCPHCRHFAEESAATLKGKMIRSGSTSVEIRSSVHDKLDLVAATVARCAGTKAFPAVHDALFAAQEAWVTQGMGYDQTNNARLAMYPQAAQLRTLADGSGIADLARANGMTTEGIDACFADPANVKKTLEVAQSISGKIRGTPSFELGGKMIGSVDWAKLEPTLRAAGAK